MASTPPILTTPPPALLDRTSGIGATTTVQSLTYQYGTLGNLNRRTDNNHNLTEAFTYDALNRLTQADLTASGVKSTNLVVHYDEIGNIKSKSGVGTYTYSPTKPHAVESISGTVNTTYTYDANGNVLTGNGKSYGWTAFNKPFEIVQGSNKTDFWYGPDRSRYKQVITDNGTTTTELYLGGLFTVIETNSQITYRHLIAAGGQAVAIYTNTSSGSQQIRYIHTNGLGSANAITDGTGAIVASMSFGAFGQRRDPATWQVPEALAAIANDRDQTYRGYTGHEELDAVGLIHMNGRVYDPQVGRFVSADPIEGGNRYSYVYNNPLSLTDPSGYCTLGCFWQPDAPADILSNQSNATDFLLTGVPTFGWSAGSHVQDEAESHWQIVVAAVAAYYTGGLAWEAGWSWAEIGAASGAAAGATYNGTTGGSVWQGAVTGGLVGAQIGGLAEGAYTAYTATQGGGLWGLAKFAGNQYLHQVTSNELGRIAERNGMSLGQLDLYLFALSEFGDLTVGSRFDSDDLYMKGWGNRGYVGLTFDFVDTLLEYQGIPSASDFDYILSSYRGLPLKGHSLGALSVDNMVSLGFAPSGSSVYALPFFNIATGGTTLTISGGDFVNGFFFGKALNPDANMIWGPFLGHSACGVYGLCF